MNLNQNKEVSAPTTLSHYRIVSKIGAGGMGEVYLAQDTRLDRQVALKILPPEFAEDKERMNRFVREAKSASALNHPNIITIHEIGETDGSHFIATEYIQGETLHTRLKQNPLDLKTTLDIAIQVASALDAAHRAGIVHRDIKPENVMIRPDGLVKILDFGIAKLSEPPTAVGGLEVDEDAATAIKPQSTSPGMVIGTANYMSPEQAKGKEVDARTDIFSVGIVFYEMLTGGRAFAGENALDTIGAILHKEPTPLKQILPSLPTEIERIVNKTLRKDRDERYQTARGLLTDLKDARQELEFQDKLERTSAPNREEAKTHLISAQTSDVGHTTSSAEFVSQEIKKHRRGFAVALVVLLSAIIGLGYWYFFHRATGVKQIESIAVMPFVNESGNADVEYLSDGMTETLISSLSQLPNLNVKARSSVFRYKGKETNPQTIGKELNVQAVLNGRVAQRGDQLTLTLELVDAETENVIWSEQYNRRQADLVTLQSEIARDVSSKLKTKLSGADEVKVTKKYTANPEAYQLYLKGRFQWNKRTGESLKQAVEFYKQAIEKDPNYALAYAGLAQSYVIFNNYSVASPRDSMPHAKAAALRALELDDSLDEAHAALGLYLSAFAWNQPAAEKELRRAIELNPNNATAYQWLGVILALAIGRSDEGIAAGRRAEELDPLSPVISADSGFCLFGARRYDEAIAQLKRALSLDPNFYYTRFNLGAVYHAKGMYSEAIVEYRKARELDDDPFVTALLARSLAKSGGRGEAAKLRDQLRAESARRYVPNIAFALVYAALDNKDEAFKWLEKDFAERTYVPSLYAFYPLLDDLRDDQHFADLVRRVALVKMD